MPPPKVLQLKESSTLHRRDMSMLVAQKDGWVPGNAVEHPDHPGVACEIVRWENDHWLGRRAGGGWEKVSGPEVFSQGYVEVDRQCTVIYRLAHG